MVFVSNGMKMAIYIGYLIIKMEKNMAIIEKCMKTAKLQLVVIIIKENIMDHMKNGIKMAR